MEKAQFHLLQHFQKKRNKLYITSAFQFWTIAQLMALNGSDFRKLLNCFACKVSHTICKVYKTDVTMEINKMLIPQSDGKHSSWTDDFDSLLTQLPTCIN